MTLAIVVQACKDERTGEPNGRSRVALFDVQMVDKTNTTEDYTDNVSLSEACEKVFGGPIIDVVEADTATEAIEYILKNHPNQQIAILTDDNQLDYPDEISLVEACEAYFGTRVKGLKF